MYGHTYCQEFVVRTEDAASAEAVAKRLSGDGGIVDGAFPGVRPFKVTVADCAVKVDIPDVPDGFHVIPALEGAAEALTAEPGVTDFYIHFEEVVHACRTFCNHWTIQMGGEVEWAGEG